MSGPERSASVGQQSDGQQGDGQQGDGERTRRLFELRNAPTDDLAGQADAVAAACHAMAVRFHRGGKLVVFGTGGASTDAQHVAVEFVHPVIVGKRALPAISLTSDVATVTGIAERDGVAAIFAHQIRFLADPADIALGISADGNCASVLCGLEAAISCLATVLVKCAKGDHHACHESNHSKCFWATFLLSRDGR